MTDHPLTDEMCEKTSRFGARSYLSMTQFSLDERARMMELDVYYDMRAAYDLAIEHVYETWNRLFDEAETATPYGRDSTIIWRFNRELKAMRPQEDN